jgi:membrane protease subunit HflC
VQRPYEDVLVDRGGKLAEPVTLIRNWKMCLPTDNVRRMDHRSHLYNSDLSTVLTQDKRPVLVRTYGAWKIVDAKKFYTAQGTDDQAQKFIDRIIGQMVQSKFAKYPLDRVFNVNGEQIVTDEIEGQILKEANQKFSDQGIELEQVGFSRMAFSPGVSESVYKSMVAERESQAVTVRAEGTAEASRLKAEGEAEANRIKREAEAEAGVLRGKGDQSAIEILGKVMTTPEAKEMYEFMKSLELLKSAMGQPGKTYFILRSDSPLVSVLENSPAKKGDKAEGGMKGAAAPATRPAATVAPGTIPANATW